MLSGLYDLFQVSSSRTRSLGRKPGYGCYQTTLLHKRGLEGARGAMSPQDAVPTLIHQLPIQHIHCLPRVKEAKPGCQDGAVCYRLGPRVVERTRTMGIIVVMGTQQASSASSGDVANHQAQDVSSFWLDDGTGVIEVLVRNDLLGALKVGDLVDVLGVITQDDCEAQGRPGNPEGARRKILAENVLVADDPNMESLRMLEMVSLYKRCYFTTPPEAPRNPAAPAVDEETVASVLAIVGEAVEGVREEVIEATVGVQRACVQAILERLQVEGSIYRAQDGAYFPL